MQAFYIINSTSRRNVRFFANTGRLALSSWLERAGLSELLIMMGYNGYNCLLLPPCQTVNVTEYSIS